MPMFTFVQAARLLTDLVIWSYIVKCDHGPRLTHCLLNGPRTPGKPLISRRRVFLGKALPANWPDGLWSTPRGKNILH